MPSQSTSRHARVSRRRFLQTTSAVGAAAFAAPAFLRGGLGANERLNLAVIGCGGRGGANLRSVAGENIVALCDVNQENIDRAAKDHGQARQYRDFRKLYDDSNRFDAVVVSTCEHTHAFATLPALQLGKHVYCEKPLTHNVWEARVIREAAAKANVATQMGIQIHSTDNYRRVVELIRSGAIGSVNEVHVWVSRAWGWHASSADAQKHKDIVFIQSRPEKQPVPSGLDWDLWLGPAPRRPFNEVYVPGPKWYRWWDFGNGTMSDLGSHWVDLPFWALNLKAPRTIEAAGPPVHEEIAPASMSAKYEYAAEGDQPALSLTWHQGVSKPDLWTAGQIPQWNSGVLFIGSKGMLISDYRKHALLPEKEFADFEPPEPTIEKSLGQHGEWLHAAKTGAPTLCNFEYSGWLTEANHLGNVAYRTGEKLVWDAKNLQVTNTDRAERFIHREYRPGWKLA